MLPTWEFLSNVSCFDVYQQIPTYEDASSRKLRIPNLFRNLLHFYYFAFNREKIHISSMLVTHILYEFDIMINLKYYLIIHKNA